MKRQITWILLSCFLVSCESNSSSSSWWKFIKKQDASSQIYLQFQKAKKLFQEKKWQASLALFLDLQSKYTHRLDIMFNVGSVYLRMGEVATKERQKDYFEKAEKHLKAVLAQGSAALRQKAHYNLGVLFARKKQYSMSLYHLSQSVDIANKELKQKDKKAEENRDLISLLIRQRSRKRQELNRTRVFRFQEKIIELRASKEYENPLEEIALKAEFTHDFNKKKVVVWGFPVSTNRWKVRFVPTLEGKWKYKIQSIRKKGVLGQWTVSDSKLSDQGLFKVLPSPRPGILKIATANRIRFAWKKSKSKMKSLQTKKSSAKTDPKKPTQKGKSPSSSAQQEKKEPRRPDDETFLLWQGLRWDAIFDPKQCNEKEFKEYFQMVQWMNPSVIHVPFDLKQWITVSADKKIKPHYEWFQPILRRIEQFRKVSNLSWAYIFELKVDAKMDDKALKMALSLLVSQTAHVDQIWSLREVAPSKVAWVKKTIRELDPNHQPIAVANDFSSATRKRMKELVEVIRQKRSQKAKPSTQKANKNNSKAPKSPKPLSAEEKELQKLQGQLIQENEVRYTSLPATSGKALQQTLVHPWITELELPQEVSPKALMRQWWNLYVAGYLGSVRILRLYSKEEQQVLQKWLKKKEEQDSLPKHPDFEPKSTKKKANSTTKPVAKISVAKKPKNKPTQASALIHFLMARHHWEQFLSKVRFHGFIRPEKVTLRIPDTEKMLQQKQNKLQPSSSQPSLSVGKKEPKDSTIWKTIQVRGFIAGNTLTTLFLPPPGQDKKPPQITWNDSRRDLEFVWFNGMTGKFLEKKILRLVSSLALAKPKEEAHIAKIMMKDHDLNQHYSMVLSQKMATTSADSELSNKDWAVEVLPPKGKKFSLPVFLGEKGYEVRIRPSLPGVWTIQWKKNGKAIPGLEGLPAKIKVVPKSNPSTLQRSKKNPMLFFQSGRPFFWFSRGMKKKDFLLVSAKEWKQQLALLKQQSPATTVLHLPFPRLKWNVASVAKKPSHLFLSAELKKQLLGLDEKLQISHQEGYYVSFSLTPSQWKEIPKAHRQAVLFYFLDRFQTAFPLIWVADMRKAKPKDMQDFVMALRVWYLLRFPPAQGKKQSKAQQEQPVEFPPVYGARIGRPGSEKRAKEFKKMFSFLWWETSHLLKDASQYKLFSLQAPLLTSWMKLSNKDFLFSKKVKGKPETIDKNLHALASFYWRSQLIGFAHHYRDFEPSSSQGLLPEENVFAILRAFFQNLDWSTLRPGIRSLKVPTFQAFGSETVGKSQDGHHMVMWVHSSVRQKLQFERVKPLKKHRYIWLNPLTGKQPLSPQLLPIFTKGKKQESLKVPSFRPSVLYLFQKPPQKSNKQQQKRKKQQPKKGTSKRQQVKNNLNNLNEDKNQMLKNMLKDKKKSDTSGIRG